METNNLLQLNVEEQKNQLENLDLEQLRELREEETRRTALDNIDREISNRQDQEKEKQGEMQDESAEKNQDSHEEKVDSSDDYSDVPSEVTETFTEQEINELQAKVDYILEKSKTVSKKGFENYEN